MADESRENDEKTIEPWKFQPGNPGGGRKPIPPDIKAALKSYLTEAIELIVKTMRDENTKKDLRVHCAEVIIERNLGKSAQPIDIDTELILKVIYENKPVKNDGAS